MPRVFDGAASSSRSFRGCARDRTEMVQSTRDLQSRPGPRRSAHPKTKKPPRGFPRAAPDRFGCFQPGLRVWSLPFVRRGLRLALDTHDGPLAGKIRRAVPIATRAYVSHDALAPCDSRGCGCDRHGLVSTKRTLARRRGEVNASIRSRLTSPAHCEAVEARGSGVSGFIAKPSKRLIASIVL